MNALARLVPGMVALALCFTGCTAAYVVNIETTPGWARVSWLNGGRIAEAPTAVTFKAEPRYMSGGCLHVHGFTATWTSGSQAHTSRSHTLPRREAIPRAVEQAN